MLTHNTNVQPPSPGSLVWFLMTCSRRRGSTAAVVTLGTIADESRKKMADRVTRSHRVGFVAETARLRFVTLDTLNRGFFRALLPTFRILSFLVPLCLIFVLLRLCSSHLLLQSISTCILPRLGIPHVFFCSFFFRISYLSDGGSVVLFSYPRCVSTCFAYLDYWRLCFISRIKNEDGHWG